MWNCPLKFNIQSNKRIVIENFTDSSKDKDCLPDSVPQDNDATDNHYAKERSSNIEKLDNKYNEELTNYLNDYNTFLLNRTMLKNSPPGSATQAQLAVATDTAKEKYESAKNRLETIQKDIEKNNVSTSKVIDQQGKEIKSKGGKIRDTEKNIVNLNKLIEEKNKILNSRTRQIELGISKNLYKRNVMWILIILIVVFTLILMILIKYRSK